MSRFILTLILLIFFLPLYGQDTLKMMHYNLMYYGKETDFCNETNNNIEEKNEYLSRIIQYTKPDIFSVNELDGDDSYPVTDDENYLLNNALNNGTIRFYRKVPFEETYLANTIFYNSNKLAFESYRPIRMNVGYFEKIINAYTFYYRSEDLKENSDTLFFTCFVAHLKAGSYYENIMERKEETEVFMNYLKNEMQTPGNYFLMGDLNVYYSDEPAFQNLINPIDSLYRFMDPPNILGNWHNNREYASYHTQSTHSSGNCFSGGGMDDRFDFILLSQELMDTSNEISYLNNSYQVKGQSGNFFNESLPLTNNGYVPDNIARALYEFSDHLPVTLKVSVNRDHADILSYDSVFIKPEKPVKEDSVKVFVDLIDTKNRVNKLSIFWGSAHNDYSSSKEMELINNFYTASLPPMKDSGKIYYRINAYDESNNSILSSEEHSYIINSATGFFANDFNHEDIVTVNNPVRNEIILHLRERFQNLRIQVGSIEGKVLMNKTLKNSGVRKIRLPVSQFKSGIYWLRIFNNNNAIINKKIMIIK